MSLPPAFGTVATPPEMAAFHPWGYYPIDFVAHADRPHIPGSVLSMMIGIEFARDRSALVAPLWETARNVRDENLRGVVARWLARLRQRYDFELPGMEELLAMEDVTVLTSRLDETIEEWHRDAVAEGHTKGVSEGRNEGLAHHRTLIGRLTALRFGRDVADGVGTMIEGVDDWNMLQSVSDLIESTNAGEVLIDRVGGLVRQPQ